MVVFRETRLHSTFASIYFLLPVVQVSVRKEFKGFYVCSVGVTPESGSMRSFHESACFSLPPASIYYKYDDHFLKKCH